MSLRCLLGVMALALVAGPLAAQSGVGAPCARSDIPAAARDYCYLVAQAVESGQPQLGILVAGGNPTLGTASTGGLRLGMLPRVSASLKANLVFIRLPKILAQQAGTAASTLNSVTGIPAPALSAAATVGVFPGISLVPTIGGVGSIDLIGSATWLPFSAAKVKGFGDAAASASYGGGVRVGILRESFLTPGASITVMRRHLGTVDYGDVCPGLSATPAGSSSQGYTFASGTCAGSGDAGEFAIDLNDWSTRAAIGKRLLGLGLTAGVGYDRFSSNVGYGFRSPTQPTSYYARATDLKVDSNRWSGFLDGSFTILVATLAAEAGWMQGNEAISGFPSTSDFHPTKGTYFGSVGVRLAL
jgi:hypothetical protein